MANIIKAALLQTDWTGDKESMIVKHEEAGARGGGPGCADRLLPGAVLTVPTSARCRMREYYDYTEYIPDGPTTQRFRSVGEGTEHGDGAADVRDRTSRRLLQHRGGDRR